MAALSGNAGSFQPCRAGADNDFGASSAGVIVCGMVSSAPWQGYGYRAPHPQHRSGQDSMLPRHRDGYRARPRSACGQYAGRRYVPGHPGHIKETCGNRMTCCCHIGDLGGGRPACRRLFDRTGEIEMRAFFILNGMTSVIAGSVWMPRG